MRRTASCLIAVLVFAWVTLPAPAAASCIGSSDPAVRALEALADQDAAAALKQVQKLLDAQLRAPVGDAKLVAALYAVQAQAYSILELDVDAREAASKGLDAAPQVDDPVHVDLLSAYAESAYDEAAIKTGIIAIEKLRAAQARGSLADTCLLISRGLLEYRQDRNELAIASLTQAYRASTGPDFAQARVAAAGVLSSVLREMGDYPQSLALNQEAIDANTAQHATLSLSVSRFLRGRIFYLMGGYDAAIDEYGKARKLSVQLNDQQGIAFADLRICDAHITLGQLERAEPECASALRLFSAEQSADEEKEARSLLARIDLASGHPEKALATFNSVLDQSGADLLPRRVALLYEWRARTNAAMHNYKDAYADLTEYLHRYSTANDADRARQAAAIRSRFETDREIERNNILQRELGVSEQRSQKQAQQLRWNAVVVVLGVLVIALLVCFLIANLRFRKQLVRLASQDGLTGLPNRRRTAELATEAFVSARDNGKPLTVAVIDMDHFKTINDRCGHATGDLVLKEFARLGLESLRAIDVLGRWGGEEFLLILPEATLDMAMAALERMRTRIFGITLPASGAGLHVSISAGLASNEHHDDSIDVLIARADAALYAAKNQGRDLVRIAEDNTMTGPSIRRQAR